ncbi:hypothetical protein ABZ863_30150 [Saccharomonospora sp. NPDC046836]|uniref:hypothetical protein n=1 Tax=Saccharomonospora sp. NPDC046836 TaxID=3156921 RepID=UPI003401245F
MMRTAEPGASHADALRRAEVLVPDAFHEGRPLNFWGGRWRRDGVAGLTAADAARAVRAGLNEHRTWSVAAPTERRLRVVAALEGLTAQREVLTALPGCATGLERSLAGVRDCVERLDGLLAGRAPLRGPVSNLAGRACPVPVLLEAVLVQALAGNAAIVNASTESAHALTLATDLAARHGVPLTLLHGGGAGVEAALTRQDVVGCVSYPDGAPRGVALVRAMTRRSVT